MLLAIMQKCYLLTSWGFDNFEYKDPSGNEYDTVKIQENTRTIVFMFGDSKFKWQMAVGVKL